MMIVHVIDDFESYYGEDDDSYYFASDSDAGDCESIRVSDKSTKHMLKSQDFFKSYCWV